MREILTAFFFSTNDPGLTSYFHIVVFAACCHMALYKATEARL